MRRLSITSTTIKNNSRQQEIEQYIAAIGGFETMPDDKGLSALYYCARAGDIHATEKAKRIWLRQIIEIAKQCSYFTDLPFDTLVAAGTEELIKYIHSSPNEEKFLSYYVWNIKQGILSRIKENSDNIA